MIKNSNKLITLELNLLDECNYEWDNLYDILC
jgi:hypothetical protein